MIVSKSFPWTEVMSFGASAQVGVGKGRRMFRKAIRQNEVNNRHFGVT